MWRLLLVATLAYGAKLPDAIDGKRMLEDVKVLSSEKYKGRMTGTPELDQAARWIAKEYQRAGLKAPFVEGNGKLSYLQKFVVSTDIKLGKRNEMSVGSQALTVAKNFMPRVNSASGNVSGEMVFAGYGITSSEHHYDDYAGLDAKGKVVVVLRNEPQDLDEKSVFDGKNRTQHANLENKAVNAKLHGAVGLIVLNNGVIYPEDAEKLDTFGGQSGAMDAGIVVVQVKWQVAEKWFAETNHDVKGIVKAIDRMLQPQSFRFPPTMKAALRVNVERVMRPTFNVAGYLPGVTDEYIVVGGHYDHLGYGRQFSMAPSEVPKLHPGADDNASGTAAVMELARYFSSLPKQKRGILFVAFSGEEIGLLGSGNLAGKMPFALEKCAAMINMDMVGRMQGGKFYVAGVGTGTTFKGILEEVVRRQADLKPDFSENLSIGGSDHTSFAAKSIPALFFFSGLHSDYHKPSDTWDKIELRAYASLIRVVAATIAELSGDGPRPMYQRQAPAATPGGPSGGGGGYGPYFGSVPDFAEVPGGVKLADVRAGSPAEKGGLRGGDLLVEFDGKKVENLQDYTYVLRSKGVGDTVEVKVKRLGKTLTFRVVLEARK
ncbi:MAG: M28 family peptidase [Acidobacteria bacterium]|nr:M28 family peptidase [Acidobacteriota bacterium]